MATLFISDLHLCAERPAITGLFLAFLKREAGAADAIYILGDLLEYWIGDEAVAQAEFQPIVAGLRAVTDGGTPLYLMHGNRDFLIGEGFAQATGCRLLEDPTVIELYGTPVVLMHGDLLCTDDVEYQGFRKMVRDPQWQQGFLAKSMAEREQISREVREHSKSAIADKRPDIMDINQQAVEAEMRRHGIYHIIHGHTHRPGQHQFQLDGMSARRTVLGDWYEQGSVLRCDRTGCALETLDLENPDAAHAASGAKAKQS